MASFAVARAYQQSFETHPHVTLALTNGCLSALGDAVAQGADRLLSKRRVGPHDDVQPYDFSRTARFFAFGLGMGPLIGRWNTFLESRFPLRSLAKGSNKVSLKALGKRVAADQLTMAPFGLVLFIGSIGVMEGRSALELRDKYAEMYQPALLANWKVWPLAQLINFRYMPLPYRVPFQSTCGVFWTLYLSILNSREDKKHDSEASNRRTLEAH